MQSVQEEIRRIVADGFISADAAATTPATEETTSEAPAEIPAVEAPIGGLGNLEGEAITEDSDIKPFGE